MKKKSNTKSSLCVSKYNTNGYSDKSGIKTQIDMVIVDLLIEECRFKSLEHLSVQTHDLKISAYCYRVHIIRHSCKV